MIVIAITIILVFNKFIIIVMKYFKIVAILYRFIINSGLKTSIELQL